MNLHIRRAPPEQADELTGIARASKAHWGYPGRWLEMWRPQSTFSPQYFAEREGWVAVLDEIPVGFYTLEEKNGNAWIENLWVSPACIGKGVGKALFAPARELAHQRGHKILQLQADPHAVGFYQRMGMRKVGEEQYELEGQPRILPIM